MLIIFNGNPHTLRDNLFKQGVWLVFINNCIDLSIAVLTCDFFQEHSFVLKFSKVLGQITCNFVLFLIPHPSLFFAQIRVSFFVRIVFLLIWFLWSFDCENGIQHYGLLLVPLLFLVVIKIVVSDVVIVRDISVVVGVESGGGSLRND